MSLHRLLQNHHSLRMIIRGVLWFSTLFLTVVPEQILDSLNQSDRVLVFLSDEAFSDDCWCDIATSLAIKLNKPITFVLQHEISRELLKSRPNVRAALKVGDLVSLTLDKRSPSLGEVTTIENSLDISIKIMISLSLPNYQHQCKVDCWVYKLFTCIIIMFRFLVLSRLFSHESRDDKVTKP